MRKRIRVAAAAAGMVGIMILANGCGSQGAAAETTAAETTAGAAETKAEEAETTAEDSGGETAGDGEETADLSANPGAVWFDKDTGTAHGNIGDTSTTEEAQAGEEVSVEEPVKVWGTVLSAEGDSLTVDNRTDMSSDETTAADNQAGTSSPNELIIHIDPAHSVVVDAVNGLPVELADVELGSFVAYLGPAMTMSLPPQTTAYVVIVNIPEDYKAPEYVIAAGPVVDTDNGRLLDCIGEQDYLLAEDAEILPYLTRNIVTAEDIKEGSRCLVWTDEYDTVTKLVLFAD